MKLNFLGGAMEVGGSCIYINIAGYGILMDSGIRQGGSKDPLPDFHTIQKCGGIDAILISHAHLDHIGTLPIISKAYPLAKIYMTHMTQDLVRVLLYDSLKIMGRNEEEIPHYSEVDVKGMLERICPLRYETTTEICKDLNVTFYQAGHIAGAACIYMVSKEGSIFYSGDFASFSQRAIEGAKIPKLRPDVSIVESTYGNRLHSNRQVEENRLVALVKECVEKEMKILIPAFALGRAQEVLLILNQAMRKNELPKVPVYVDGMVRDINTIYYRNPTYLKNALAKKIWKGNDIFYSDEIKAVKANMKREELLEQKGAVVFVASSGMLTGGPSMMYAKRIASMENGCIIITGYQDEESPGRALLNLLEEKEERKLTIDGTCISVKCQVEQVGLSAHGDKSEITMLMERISARRIFLVHGNEEAIQDVGQELSSDYRCKVYTPICGEEYEIELKNKRTQIDQTLKFSMQRQEKFTIEGEVLLWNYCREHYKGKNFTLNQLAFVWCGKNITDEVILQEFQETLMKSAYFSPNSKRLFLFNANSEEDVLENTKEKELTIQELEVYVKNIVVDIPYKKVGFYLEKKEVVLTLDFPDAYEKSMYEKYAKEFENATGWKLEISPSVNHQAMNTLLRSLFEDRIQKISYYQDKKQYVISLKENAETDKECAESYSEKTGWSLMIKGSDICGKSDVNVGKGVSINDKNSLMHVPESDAERMEQNETFAYMDYFFEQKEVKPYKKGIKSDANGKYIELSFLSTALGLRVVESIQSLANKTGYRISIADGVNQNAIMTILGSLCEKYEIPLLKNPSYLPESKVFKIKAEVTELPVQMQEEFETLTGCKVGLK